MKITIQEKNNNPLLKRIEVKGTLEFEKETPSNVQLVEHLAKEFKKDFNLIIVKQISTRFGHKIADFFAFVYEDLDAKNKVEMNTKHLKKKAEEERKKAEEEAEAKAEEERKKAEEAAAAKEAEEKVEGSE